jgi:predicted kinase
MNKETSSRVSTIAAEILRREPAQGIASPEANVTAYNSLLEKAKILAGSAMSQDETPGQQPKSDATGIHPAPEEFSQAVAADPILHFSQAQVAADPILHFFHYAHLPPQLRGTSRAFFLLAAHVINTVPRNAERTVALRKLLEAKDAAVRANLPTPPMGGRVASKEDEEFKTTARQLDDDEDAQIIETGGADHVRDGDPPFNG